MQQLLWIETLLKFSGGMVLALTPLTAIRVLGLPGADSGAGAFWPRLLGAVLIGLAAAIYLEGRFGGTPRGLGLAGCFLVNIASVAMLVSHMVLSKGVQTRRGQSILWLLVAALLLLIVFEIAHI